MHGSDLNSLFTGLNLAKTEEIHNEDEEKSHSLATSRSEIS